MPIRKGRIWFPYKTCGKMFPRTGRACMICEPCQIKGHRRLRLLIKRRRLNGIYKTKAKVL